MTINPKFAPALKWYKGKSLEGAKFALAQLTEAVELGYWPSGYSRSVSAKLNKMSEAKKWAVKNIGTYSGASYTNPLYDAWSAMFFGKFAAAPSFLARNWDGAESNLKATVIEWAADFDDIADAVATLDATRPKPVYFMKTLSATVLDNVGKAMGIDLKTVQMPEIVWIKVKGLDVKGKETWSWVPDIKWPEGTKHYTSKFSCGNHCEACGHAIKNPFNWVPILAYTTEGPVSLWTGKDCAENLFGCEVKNETAMPGSPAVAK